MKERLKPIVSENHLKGNEVYFFNVEKINLIDTEKQKKSSSLIVNNYPSQPQAQLIQNSKLIK